MNKNLNVPNVLSVVRLLLVGVFVYVFFAVSPRVSGFVAVAAALTDIVDGFVARRFHMVTNLGKIIDPLADKMIQAAICLCIGIRYRIPILPVLFVLKELAMIVGSFIILRSGKMIPGAQWYGKLATVVFFACTLAILFFCEESDFWPVVILLLVAAAFMVLSFVNYSRVFLRLNRKTGHAPERDEE